MGASKAAVPSENINCTSKAGPGDLRRLKMQNEHEMNAGSLIVETEVSAPGGWSQKKLDSVVQSRMLSEDTRIEMEEMLSEVDGLQEASSGEMTFDKMEGARSDAEEIRNADPVTTSASPQYIGATPSPSAITTSLRGKESSTIEGDN